MEQPDPISLVAQACYPHLLSLDDLLAARCVCKTWHNSLSTPCCNTWRLPQSLWQSADINIQTHEIIRAAAAAYAHTPNLLLDSGTGRPSVPLQMWMPLLKRLRRWFIADGPEAVRQFRMHLRNPPSPTQLAAFKELWYLRALRIQHSHSAVYSRHLALLADLTQLQALELHMEMPRLELRSLAHQRLRRAPVNGDFLGSLSGLRRLEVTCKAHTGELLPDTLVYFTEPSVLARFSCLTHLALSELALPDRFPVEAWLKGLEHLQSLQLVLQDNPATVANRSVAAGSSSGGTCSAGGAAAGGNAGLLGGGGLSAALAAAAQAAGGTRADQQLAVAQQNLLAGLQNLSSALQQAANTGTAFGRTGGAAAGGSHHHHHHHHTPHQLSPAGPSASSSAGGAAPAVAAAAGGVPGGQLGRTSSSTSTNGAETPHAPHGAAAAPAPAPAEAARPLLPIKLSNACPGLNDLVLANLYGDRLVKLTIPKGLTRLVLHLANPTPGNVTGEQLSAVVLQAADSLLALELGLGMRFSLSGTVMRGLKRNLKLLRDLTLVEGAQDHLEGLGCWCNLPRLTLVEGRCTVPLRGLYELSMRAAMGRTPGVLRYHGHARHIEELASRLGPALQELRLDSLAGLGTGYRPNATGSCSGSSNGSSPSSPAAGPAASQPQGAGAGQVGSESGEEDGGSPEAALLPALAQLSCMTRLEVVGEQIGQLDAGGVIVLSSCKQLRVLKIEGREAWLSPELGVKEQLEWLGQLPQLRQLKLSGVMLGRSQLSARGAAAPAAAGQVAPGASPARDAHASSSSSDGGGSNASSSSADSATSAHDSSSSAKGRGSNGGGSAATADSNGSDGSNATPAPEVLAVKGLGNGLGGGPSAGKGPAGAAAAATPASGADGSTAATADASTASGADGRPAVKLTGRAAAKAEARAAAIARGVPARPPRPVLHPVAAAKVAAIYRARAAEGTDTPEFSKMFARLATVANDQLQNLTVKALTGQLPASAARAHKGQLQAAQQDAAIAVCLEEVRRWLVEMLPNCRVWLD